MVFSSIPVYSDHPNWHQVQRASINENSQLQQQQQPPPPPQVGGGSGGSGGVRPGSMVDRARLAKVPQPEAGLNCPRCDSTNTKFCYFNNYSLTQPRHFCKACRRYWTRGGALRNVPVGGGYRKNKRSKNSASSSKSQATGPKSTSVSPSPSSSSHFPQPPPQFSFMATLQGLGQYGGGNIGSNINGFQPQMAAIGTGGEADLGFQIGGNSGGSSNLLVGGVEQWRLPFLGGLDQLPTNFYPHQPPVKMEETQGQGLNFSRQFFSVPETSQWGDFPGVNSSSTSQML